MPFRNTHEAYGSVAKGLHWLMALLIIGMLALGLWMASLPFGPDMLKIYGLHKSIGACVLGLAVLRLCWRLSNPVPVEEPMPRWMALAARMSHFLLYVCMFAMPLSGWAMSSASGFPVSVFGWFTLPNLVAPDKELAKLLRETHENIGYILIALVGVHAGAALFHHFIRKDATLLRMLPARKTAAKTAALGLALALVVLPAARAADAPAAPAYTLVSGKSTLGFTAIQNSAPVEGRFKAFTADIRFDPKNLEGSSIRATVDISSLETDMPQAAEQLKTADWLDTASFPKAEFRTTAIHEMPGPGGKPIGYYAEAELTLRGKTVPVSLNFTLEEFDASHAVAVGTVPLLRHDFGVGQGQWAATDAVKDNVTVKFRITATRSGQ